MFFNGVFIFLFFFHHTSSLFFFFHDEEEEDAAVANVGEGLGRVKPGHLGSRASFPADDAHTCSNFYGSAALSHETREENKLTSSDLQPLRWNDVFNDAQSE